MEINEVREDRIIMEAVVDAYDETERAMGWYYYLEDRLKFPFAAKWITNNSAMEIEVVAMASEDDCLEDMLVEITYEEDGVKDIFTVGLADIHPINEDETTKEAVRDWHYWLARGYEF